MDVTGTVFNYGLAIDLTPLPTAKVMSEGKKTLNQLNPDDAKLVLKIYDLFKKALRTHDVQQLSSRNRSQGGGCLTF